MKESICGEDIIGKHYIGGKKTLKNLLSLFVTLLNEKAWVLMLWRPSVQGRGKAQSSTKVLTHSMLNKHLCAQGVCLLL